MPRRKIAAIPAAGLPDEAALSGALPALCRRVRFLREKRGLEQKELAARLGVTANAVSNWENGRSRPDLNLLPALGRELGVSLDELFGLEAFGSAAGASSLPADAAENQLLGRFRELSPGHRAAVLRLADALLEAQAQERLPSVRELVRYGRRLSAGPGDPTEFDEDGAPLYVYASPETERADCVFTVNGESMEPVFHSGDMVLVSRIPDAPALRPGEVGAFIAGNETYIKVYEEDGLHSLNPAFPTLTFGESTPVYLIGRVVGTLEPRQIASAADAERYLAAKVQG